MFVRFRKLSNAGFEPAGAAPGAAVSTRERVSTWEQRHEKRARRRWTIGGLEPYRIKVQLLENTRVAGKVRQEIVAVLGSIDATFLESFWERAPDPALRHQRWEEFSLGARVAFWDGVLERMGAIGDNRLNKDDRIAIRRAIHKIIPWVMEPERKRLELLTAQSEFRSGQLTHSMIEGRIARDEKTAKEIAERLPEMKAESAGLAAALLEAGLRITKLNQG
jgi:hypothetical protein